MDLKLKDEITKLLIENPGISVSEIAKKTKNYYSYTHKLLKEMEKQDLLNIKKIKKGKKELTVCNLNPEYKKDWVNGVKKFFKSMLKDAEVKAALLLSYGFILINQLNKFEPKNDMLMGAVFEDSLQSLEERAISVSLINFDWVQLGIIVIVPILLLIYFYKKNKKN